MGVKRWKVKRGHEENHEAEAINSAGQEKNGKDAEEEKAVCFNGYDATSTTTASRPNPASRPNRSIWQWHAARTDSRRAKARNIARWVLPQTALTAAGATMPASAHSGTLLGDGLGTSPGRVGAHPVMAKGRAARGHEGKIQR